MAQKKYEAWITPDSLLLIEGWARRGLDKQEIAHNMGIQPATLSHWLKSYPQIDQAIKNGKEITDIKVENSLVRSALGFEYEEVTRERVGRQVPRLDNDGNEIDGLFDEVYEMETTKIVKKVQPPNATSMIFYLKNKLPEHYRDRKEVHNTGNMGAGQSEMSGLTTEEIRDALNALKKKGETDAKKDN